MYHYEINEIVDGVKNGIGSQFDRFAHYISYMFRISSAKTKEELEEIRKDCQGSWYDSACKSYIDLKLSQLENTKVEEEKNKNKREKAYETHELVEGEYYYLYLSDVDQLVVPIKGTDITSNAEVFDRIPVIAVYKDNELIDIVSGTKVSLNPLDLYTYQFRNVILADYVVKMNKEEMKSSLSILFSLTEDEKSSYGHELVEKYGAFSDRNKEETMRLINRGGN